MKTEIRVPEWFKVNKYKMEVLMKKTTILAVIMIVAQGSFALNPGGKPNNVKAQQETRSALKAMGVKMSKEDAVKAAKNELGVNNESLTADRMSEGLIKLTEEALEIRKNGGNENYKNGIIAILNSVGKAEDVVPKGKLTENQQNKLTASEAGNRLISEVLPQLIAEGNSPESIALISAIGKYTSAGAARSIATYKAISEVYGLTKAHEIMAKIKELRNCKL